MKNTLIILLLATSISIITLAILAIHLNTRESELLKQQQSQVQTCNEKARALLHTDDVITTMLLNHDDALIDAYNNDQELTDEEYNNFVSYSETISDKLDTRLDLVNEVRSVCR